MKKIQFNESFIAYEFKDLEASSQEEAMRTHARLWMAAVDTGIDAPFEGMTPEIRDEIGYLNQRLKVDPKAAENAIIDIFGDEVKKALDGVLFFGSGGIRIPFEDNGHGGLMIDDRDVTILDSEDEIDDTVWRISRDDVRGVMEDMPEIDEKHYDELLRRVDGRIEIYDWQGTVSETLSVHYDSIVDEDDPEEIDYNPEYANDREGESPKFK
jgi:hypothetical protein